MDLAEFLTDKLQHTSYRAMAKRTGVSRGALEAIVNRQTGESPKIGTLTRIARAYGKPLWEVVEMAGAELDMPQNDTNRARRLAQLVERQPKFEHVAKRLLAMVDTHPDFVDGIIAGVEAAMGGAPDESNQ